MADSAAARPAATKRSLFSKKPVWALSKQSQALEADTNDIFTHSTSDSLNQLWREREQERRREKEKAQRRVDREQRRKSDQSPVVDSASKRRRISDDDYKRFGLESPAKKDLATKSPDANGRMDIEADFAGITNAQPSDAVKDRSRSAVDAAKDGPASPRKRGGTRRDVNVVALSSDDEPANAVPLRKQHAAPPEAPIDSDEEFPDLVAAARRRRAEQSGEPGGETRASNASARPHSRTNGVTTQPRSSSSRGVTNAVTEPDPILKIFITSPIANTKPLLVHRRLSQRFQEIRSVWCSKQGFTEDQTRGVFLIYKMRRIYDATTCKSLGIKADASGKVIFEDAKKRDVFSTKIRGLDDDGVDENEAEQVHVQAVTGEAFRDLKKQRDAATEKARSAAAAANSQVAEDGVDTPEESQAAETKLKVMLKAKGFPDFKLIVRPSTTVEKIMGAFRREHKVSRNKEIVLLFDGERLEPEAEVSSTEIEDMDAIEVYLR